MRQVPDKVEELFFSFEGGLAPMPTIELFARSGTRFTMEGIVKNSQVLRI